MTVVGPSRDTLPGFNFAKTLAAEGMAVFEADGEDIDQVYKAVAQTIRHEGPAMVILHRLICPGIQLLEGESSISFVYLLPRNVSMTRR